MKATIVPMAESPYRLPTVRDIERLAFDGQISMEELCRRAGIHPTTFRYWKAGRSSPSLATVQALIDAGLAAAKAAAQVEAAGAASPRRKPAAKPAAPKRTARSKAAAAKRAARRPR